VFLFLSFIAQIGQTVAVTHCHSRQLDGASEYLAVVLLNTTLNVAMTARVKEQSLH